MSGSRNSLKKLETFNPRASNQWSNDDSKFGQKMLEKMGWKKGQGIGLNNQGMAENIKVRLKLDSKGLGYKIKEDQWVEVRNEFSDLLSQLSQNAETENGAIEKEKKSLEAVSQSSRTRVHYHKFTHGKDIAKYKKEDLIGILGKKEIEPSIVPDKEEFIQSGSMVEYFHSKRKKSKKVDSTPCAENKIEEMNSKQSNSSYEDSVIVDETAYDIQNEDTVIRATSSKKRKLVPDDHEMDIKGKKKHKKHKKREIIELDDEYAEKHVLEDEIKINDCPENFQNRKKKVRSDSSNLNTNNTEMHHDNIAVDINHSTKEENPVPKKKKSKSKSSSIADENLSTDKMNEPQTSENPNKIHRKKKRKCIENIDESVPNSNHNVISEAEPEQVHDVMNKKKRTKLKCSGQDIKESKIPENLEVSKNATSSSVKEFLKCFGDDNASRGVEDFIKNFETRQEELLNKYREKYKMKSSLSTAESIVVYGDEFDGRKLDCKNNQTEDQSKNFRTKNLSKAEKIVAKAKLLKSIKNNEVTHNFKGSNLATIPGYGSVIC